MRWRLIARLRKVGVESQAIEQPTDLSIPENKLILACYLAILEVENDPRVLNVIFGMRNSNHFVSDFKKLANNI